jgi:hypothetical protein
MVEVVGCELEIERNPNPRLAKIYPQRAGEICEPRAGWVIDAGASVNPSTNIGVQVEYRSRRPFSRNRWTREFEVPYYWRGINSQVSQVKEPIGRRLCAGG